MTDWSYDAWAPVDPSVWGELRHDHFTEQDCHVDLGCGTVKKGRIGIDRYPAPGVNVVMNLNTLGVHAIAPGPNRDAVEDVGGMLRYHWPGRLASEIHPGPWLDYAKVSRYEEYDILQGTRQLPFPESSIESIISHHCLEHLSDGFVPLMDEIYRVLKPRGTFRAIVPLFPSTSAIVDPDHKRYFVEGTFNYFCGHLGDENNPTGSWQDSFSVPYTKARFELIDEDSTAPVAEEDRWTSVDVRELRVALRAVK